MTTDRAGHTEQVSIWVTIILGLYDPPRNPRKRERATNQQIVDPPPCSLSLKIPFPQGSAGSSPASGNYSLAPPSS
jgi:hypothetical protein